MGTQGATCAHTLTSETRDIPKDQWDDERFGQICEKFEAFADWKSVLEKLCSATKKCTYEDLKKLDEVFQRIEVVHGRAHLP